MQRLIKGIQSTFKSNNSAFTNVQKNNVQRVIPNNPTPKAENEARRPPSQPISNNNNDDDDSENFHDDTDSDISIDTLPYPNACDMDKQIYWPSYKPTLEEEYQGTMSLDKQRDGVGMLTNNESKYVGEWQGNLRHGIGCERSTGVQNIELFKQGRWERGEFIEGNARVMIDEKCLPQESNAHLLIKGVLYEGKVIESLFNDLGWLDLTIVNKKYRIIGIWKNGKLSRCLENELDNERQSVLNRLLQMFDSNHSQALPIFDRFKIYTALVDEHGNYNVVVQQDETLATFIRLLTSIDSKVILYLEHIHRLDSTMQWLNRICSDDFKFPLCNTKKTIFDSIVKENQKHLKTCLQVLYATHCVVSERHSATLSMYKKIESFLYERDNNKLLLIASEVIKYFVRRLNLIDQYAIQVKKQYRDAFASRHSYFLQQHWEYYLNKITQPRKKGTLPLNKFIDCHLAFYEQLLTCSVKIFNNYNNDVNYFENISQLNKQPLKADNKQVDSDGTVREFGGAKLKKLLNEYDVWYACCNNFTMEIVEQCEKKEALLKLFDMDQSGEIIKDFEWEQDKKLTVDVLLWYYLPTLPSFRHELSQVNREESNALIKHYQQFISLTPGRYQSWRSILSGIQDFVEFEGAKVCQDLIKNVTRALCEMKNIDDFIALFRLYTTFLKNESFDILENLSKTLPITHSNVVINIINNIRRFVQGCLAADLGPNVHIEAISAFSNLLVRIAKLDRGWHIDKEMYKALNITDKDFRPFDGKDDKSIHTIIDAKEFVEKFRVDEAKVPIHTTYSIIDKALHKILSFNGLANQSSIIQYQGLIELIKIVEQLTTEIPKQVGSVSLVQFSNTLLARLDYVTQNCTDLKILCKRCESMDLFINYESKLKEITVERALKLFKETNPSFTDQILGRLSTSHHQYIELYNRLKIDYINKQIDVVTLNRNLHELVSTEGLLVDWSAKTRRDLIPHILSYVSLILGIRASNLEEDSALERQDTYFIQPHCIQILGVMRLLAVDTDDASLTNQLAEILTGQGKSWAIALLAAVLAITGHEVTILCYSENLTLRDKYAMTAFYKICGVADKITYLTIREMASSIIQFINIDNKETVSLRELLNKIIKNETSKMNLKQKLVSDDSILVFDEVDVLLSDYYDVTFNPVCICENKTMAETQEVIWKSVKQKNQEIRASLSFDLHDTVLNQSKLIEHEIQIAIKSAQSIHKGHHSEHFRFDENQKRVQYRTSKAGDYSEHTFSDYLNAFYYLQYCDAHAISPYVPSFYTYGYFRIPIGAVAYAQIPHCFKRMLGVTGTLKYTSKSDEDALTRYGLSAKNRSYFPSFWGSSKRKVEFKLCANRQALAEYIRDQAKVLTAAGRAVLIFFETPEKLKYFDENYATEFSCVHHVIPSVSAYEDEAKHRKIINILSGQPGAVTLLTAKYGRGEDFKVSASVNEKEGSVVIGTFLSLNKREEIQIASRTARKQDPGTFILALDVEEVNQVLNTSLSCDTSYSELDRLRQEAYVKQRIVLPQTMATNENEHKKTMEFMQSLIGIFKKPYLEQQDRRKTLDSLNTMAGYT